MTRIRRSSSNLKQTWQSRRSPALPRKRMPILSQRMAMNTQEDKLTSTYSAKTLPQWKQNSSESSSFWAINLNNKQPLKACVLSKHAASLISRSITPEASTLCKSNRTCRNPRSKSGGRNRWERTSSQYSSLKISRLRRSSQAHLSRIRSENKW